MPPFLQRGLLLPHFHCTLMLTVAVLLAMFGSVESAMVAAPSVITVLDDLKRFEEMK